MAVPEGVSGRRGLWLRVVRSPGVILVGLGVLAGAGATGFVMNSARFSDADGFAKAGRVLLSTH
jgi:hypothetical protein